MSTTLMKRDAGEMATTNGTKTEPQTLSTYIQSRFDECSRSQKDVAQYIIDHLDEAAFQTAEELARRANTSSSTVVRFSQALGFEGFPELQRAAREEYKRAHGAAADHPSPLFAIEVSNSVRSIAKSGEELSAAAPWARLYSSRAARWSSGKPSNPSACENRTTVELDVFARRASSSAVWKAASSR